MKIKKKAFLNITLILIIGSISVFEQGGFKPYLESASIRQDTEFTDLKVIEQAFKNQQSDIQVRQRGIITRILKDDLRGSRHQKFIVRLKKGLNLLIVHNIDLAPRVTGLVPGETITFFGEYEWNHKGGLVHWTHHDPQGKHVAGWLEYRGKRYQ